MEATKKILAGDHSCVDILGNSRVHFIRRLVDEFYTEAKKVRIILDNLNTHFQKSIEQAFSVQEAERLLKRIEFCHTLNHASWLNMAEIEIGILEKACLNWSIGTEEEMIQEAEAWTAKNA